MNNDGASDLLALGLGGGLKSLHELVIVGLAEPCFDNLNLDGLEMTARIKERVIFLSQATFLKMIGALDPR